MEGESKEMGDQRNPTEGQRETICAGTKRNGEICGSRRVTVSGYCFAHDPESASWRAMGGRATSRKRLAAKWAKDAGVGHLYETLEEGILKLNEQERTSANIQAMAGAMDVMMKLINWSEPEPDILDYNGNSATQAHAMDAILARVSRASRPRIHGRPGLP